MEKSKQFILDLIAAGPQTKRRQNLRQLSRALGKNDAYLQQYIHRGSPRILPEQVRYQLARLLGTDEQYLAQSYWQADNLPETAPIIQSIPLLGPDAENPFLLQYFAREDLLKLVPHTHLEHLRMAIIEDDSMVPTVPAGASIMINLADTNITLCSNQTQQRKPPISGQNLNDKTLLNERLFLFRHQNGLTLRNACEVSTSDQIKSYVRLTSSNPAYGTIRIAKTDIQLVGRVIWYGRSLL